MVSSEGPSRRTNSTLVRSGKRDRPRSPGRARGRPRRVRRPRSPRAGCPSRPPRASTERSPYGEILPASPAGNRARPIRTSTRSSSSTRTDTGPPPVMMRPSAGSRPAAAGGGRRCGSRCRSSRPGCRRVPDGHPRRAVGIGGHLQDAVAPDADVRVEDHARAIGGDGQRPLPALDDEVVVADPVPLGELHPPEATGSAPPPRHRASSRGSASSAGASPRSERHDARGLAQPGELLAGEPPGPGRPGARAVRRARARRRGIAATSRPRSPARLARDPGGVEGGLELGHQAVVELAPHPHRDAPVEHLAGRVSPTTGSARTSPPHRPRPGRAGGAGRRRSRGPGPRRGLAASTRSAASGSRAAQRGEGGRGIVERQRLRPGPHSRVGRRGELSRAMAARR